MKQLIHTTSHMGLKELTTEFWRLATEGMASNEITFEHAQRFGELAKEGLDIVSGRVALEDKDKTTRLQKIIDAIRTEIPVIWLETKNGHNEDPK